MYWLAGGSRNEDLFNLKQLADGLGGQALLYTRMGGGELTSAFGVSAGTNFSELGAGATILVVASDLYNEAPVWYLSLKQAAKRGATLILVNGRETKLERYAKFVVRYAYGDEIETVNGLKDKPKIGDALAVLPGIWSFYMVQTVWGWKVPPPWRLRVPGWSKNAPANPTTA